MNHLAQLKLLNCRHPCFWGLKRAAASCTISFTVYLARCSCCRNPQDRCCRPADGKKNEIHSQVVLLLSFLTWVCPFKNCVCPDYLNSSYILILMWLDGCVCVKLRTSSVCVCVCVHEGGSAGCLALAVKLAPFSYRCQVFCLAVRPAGGGHEWRVLGCCERLGKEGVMCRVSLLSRPARPKAEAKRAQEALEAA